MAELTMEGGWLVIACARPGLLRAGHAHPQSAAHRLEDFTPAQLREMLGEPLLTLVLGEPLSEAGIDAYEKAREARAAAPKKGR